MPKGYSQPVKYKHTQVHKPFQDTNPLQVNLCHATVLELFGKTPHLAQHASKQHGLQTHTFKQHSAPTSKHSNDADQKTCRLIHTS